WSGRLLRGRGRLPIEQFLLNLRTNTQGLGVGWRRRRRRGRLLLRGALPQVAGRELVREGLQALCLRQTAAALHGVRRDHLLELVVVWSVRRTHVCADICPIVQDAAEWNPGAFRVCSEDGQMAGVDAELRRVSRVAATVVERLANAIE